MAPVYPNPISSGSLYFGKEVISYGIFDASGKLYNAEMGPRGGDEVNVIVKGKNYGWPIITYGKEYWGPSIGQKEKPGLEQPLVKWVPSISPSGLTFYTGTRFKKFKDNFLN